MTLLTASPSSPTDLVATAPPEVLAAEAFDNARDIARTKKHIGAQFLHLGQLLKDNRERGLFRALGYETFNLFLASPEVDIAPSTAYNYIRILDEFATVDRAKLYAIGVTKLMRILTVRVPARRAELLELAEHGSEQDLRTRIEEFNELDTASEIREIAATIAAEAGEPVPATLYFDDPADLAPFNAWLLLADPAQFRDATDPLIASQLLLRYTRPGERVLDLTAGIGTVADVAHAMSRRVTSYDRISLRPDVTAADARAVEEPAIYPLVVFHPPVWNETRYSEIYADAPLAGDLSLLDLASFVAACATIITRARDFLAPGGVLAVIARGTRSEGRWVDLPGQYILAAKRAGLSLIEDAVAVASPTMRQQALRKDGFRAGRENIMLPAYARVLLFRTLTPERSR